MPRGWGMPLLKSAGLLCVLLFSYSHAGAAVGPQELVEATSNKMLERLRAEQKALKQNPQLIYDMVSDIVLPHFDFIAMSRSVLGKHWRTADLDGKKRFVLAFRDTLVRTYAVALLEYTEQKVRYLPLRDDPATKDVTVWTEIIESGKAPISIKYSLHLKKDQWKVYDVSVDGVSLIANYRTSFASEVTKTGLNALIERLEQHNRKAGLK
ncbi:MAG: ABC transporter substrate-binding protein [Gammaproteobacteria bacterium]|nr:ABC transporter substrate-binding protein [Gammaproteobacteria bacterium]MDH5653633.1 ABC transporter substrate-binding protein [Gammaproteobacteria bacterium]